MKLYIAGKWSEKQEISDMIDFFRGAGYVITHDWTKVEFETRDSHSLGTMAELDINGIKQADVLIALMNDPEYAYRGTFTEIGCALGANKQVIIISNNQPDVIPNYQSNCFYHHPEIVHVITWNDVISYLSQS